MTAKEFLEKKGYYDGGYFPIDLVDAPSILNEFAKLKVQECKEAIHNSAYVEFLDKQGEPIVGERLVIDKVHDVIINPDSILNSYNIED